MTLSLKRCSRRLVVKALLIAMVCAPFAGIVADDDPLLAESRAITAEFAAEMQAALQASMASGGPAAAIGACRDLAPQIAATLSAKSGAIVSRTSLRVRNLQNRPENWQTEILEEFEQGTASTEHFERLSDGSARYMKAIPTGALCLNCHGTILAPDVRASIDVAYPDDQARGYYLGDVRGAFSVVWPVAD